jgi:hypothetical protein
VCKWTNEVLVGKGKKDCGIKEFYAYIGLELGVSLLKFNEIKRYWAQGCFLSHETCFEEICACV